MNIKKKKSSQSNRSDQNLQKIVENNGETSSSSLQSSQSDRNQRNTVKPVDMTQMVEMNEMIELMSAVCNISLNQLESACNTVRLLRSKSTLGTRETEISEADAPLLAMFEKYALPLKTTEEVEQLENSLANSDDFLKFFVS